MSNVQTGCLITKDVKKTVRELVVRAVMSTPALRDVFMPQQNAARGIIPMVHAVLLQLPPDVRPIIKSTVQELLPVPIPAVTPAIAAAMIPVRPGLLKTIPDLIQQQPSAGQDVTDVKTVLPAALLIPVLMSDLPNAELVMLVMILVNPVRSPCLALPIM